MQEEVGLKAVTDGEARRSFWHYDFMGMLDGFDLVEREEGVQFAGVKLRPIFPTISGKLGFPDDHPMLVIFNKNDVDIYFMEYDIDRAGGLEPLKLLPKGAKRVMPGFVTTKTGDLETLDDLKAKFDEASKYVDIDQLGIAPQCGLASTEEGNSITPDDQRRKLDLIVKVAEEVWGGV
ncbi:hypothetical protein [Primorskyibacter flagellatus]|uniref:hypothetical protein n=1 Tax=Primorskyibacter flagellatus TaxID=1387277 RepID=UPI003A8FDAF2